MASVYPRVLRPQHVRHSCSGVLPGVLLALMACGCGVPSQEELAGTPALASDSSSLESDNGFSLNGLGTNGLGTNGLSTSGLSISAMNTAEFVTWFNQNPALTSTVMKYVVKCAVPAGSTRSWTNPTTGISYLWNGSLGLTPNWSGGAPATELEQQLITACLAAHTNKFGRHVPFSVQGLAATGTPIPTGPLEFIAFPEREACFFGNLFTGEGIYAGNDSVLPVSYSSVRACGLESPEAGNLCEPIQHVNPCSELCTLDSQGNYYTSCGYNGKSYRALTTRIRSTDIYVCGDGVCQISESCGNGLSANNCMDCGPCP